jgi:hypothetical protein
VSDNWPQNFSRDGRWVMSFQDGWKSVAIVATATGTTALRLDPGPNAVPGLCAFAPDDSRVAVHWRPDWRLPGAPGAHAVTIHELPSGRELRRLPLPDRPWECTNEWRDDGRLYAYTREEDPAAPEYAILRSVSFSLADADFGAARPEPLRTGRVGRDEKSYFAKAGSDWVARLDWTGRPHRSPVEQALDWLDRRLKTSLAPRRVDRIRVRVLDAATGSERCDLRLADSCAIAPDGRWVATGGEVAEVWAVPPPRQGLWTAGAGLLAAGGVLLAARRRRSLSIRSRRLTQRPAPST